MRIIKLLFFLLLTNNISFFIHAQQVNTLYFLKEIPVRHFLNPSFQPLTDYYISLPIIGFTQFNVSNNSISLKDIIFNENGKTVSFLNSGENENRFFNTLKNNILIQTDFQTNILSVGFRHETAYWTFSLTEKIDGSANLPKDIFKISLFGTPNPQNNSFDFTTLQSDISAYTEVALGYSKKIDDKWTIGGKFKLLLGQANFSNNNYQFLLKAGADKWTFNGKGTANYSGPVNVGTTNNFQTFSYIEPANINDWLKPSGIGAGIDLGFEYQLDKNIRLSGAMNDIGFIRWTKNTQNYQYGIDYSFNGIGSIQSNKNTFQDVYNQLILNNVLINKIINGFNSSKSSKITSQSFITFTTAKINFGFEYSLLNDKISFGLLSYSQLFKDILAEELTLSLNARPYSWLNASLSYSLFQGRLSTIGAGIGLKTGILQWFVAADFIPFEKTTLSLSDLGVTNSNIKIPIPYNSTSFNLSVGLNIVFNKKVRENWGLMRSNERQDCNCNWK